VDIVRRASANSAWDIWARWTRFAKGCWCWSSAGRRGSRRSRGVAEDVRRGHPPWHQRRDTDDVTAPSWPPRRGRASRRRSSRRDRQLPRRVRAAAARLLAVKIEGERAYRRARRGEVVTPEPRPVEIRELEIVEAAVPDLGFRATVSAGTLCARWRATSARSWGAAPISRRCGARPSGRCARGCGGTGRSDAIGVADAALLVAHMPRRQVNKKERMPCCTDVRFSGRR